MSLIRWEPARELSSLQGEMNRLLNTFFDSPATGGGVLQRWVPAMDLLEEGDHFVLRADLPGMGEDDVRVEVEDGVLSVSGERKQESQEKREGYQRIERASGSFRRTLTLPDGVDAEQIKAEFDKGVLEVRIPKPEQRRSQRVQIGIGGAPKTIDVQEPAA